MDKLFDYNDLEDKAKWLEALAGYVEWDYPLTYQRDIDRVLKLLKQMMENEKRGNKADGETEKL